MAASCPNTSSPEWKSLVKAVGSNNAMKLFIANGDSIIHPEVGAFQLFAELKPEDAFDILDANIALNDKKKFDADTTINDIIGLADPIIFEDPTFLSWAKDNGFKLDDIEEVKETEKKKEPVPELIPEINLMNAVKNGAELQNKARAEEILYKIGVMMTKMSAQTGVEAEMVDSDVATMLLEKTTTPYENQAGFFYNGKAYFVTGRVTLGTVLHEFSHPIVGSIRLRNNVLFNNLYNKVSGSKTGQSIIDEITNENKLTPNSNEFKEEAIVRALERDAVDNKKLEPAFNSAIKEILYAIKQWFRKVFGKVKVENLSPSTTINELADMIINKDFQINIEEVTDAKVAQFSSENKSWTDALIKDIEKAKSEPKLQGIIDNLFAQMKVDENKLRQYGFKGVKDILEGEISSAKQNLYGISTSAIKDEDTRKAHERLTLGNKATNLINSLVKLKAVSAKILKQVNEMTADVNEQNAVDYLNQAGYYNKLLGEWENLISNINSDIYAAGVDPSNPVNQLIGPIGNFIEQGLKEIKKLELKAVTEVSYGFIESYNENVDARFKKRIEELKQVLAKSPGNKAAKAELETAQKEYKDFTFDKDKIAGVLRGELGSASWFDGMLQSYTNNRDPIIGGFATFIKNNISRIEQYAIARQQGFNSSNKDLIKKILKNEGNFRKEWEFATEIDQQYVYEDGKKVLKPVATFLSTTKNRYKLEEMQMAIDNAKIALDKAKRENTGIEEAEQNLTNAYKKLNKEKRDFWNQEYKKEVYEARDKIFDVTAEIDGKTVQVGREAWTERTDVLNNIAEQLGVSFSELELYSKHDQQTALWRQYSDLYSLVNEDGTDKTGLDLLKAQALIDHRTRMKKYEKWIDKQGTFDTALEAFENQLITSGLKPGDKKFQDEVTDWIKVNTSPGYTEEYYNQVSSLIGELKALSAQLPDALKATMGTDEDFNILNSLMIGYKDELGQPIGTEVPEEKVNRLREIQERLERLRESINPVRGLTLEETVEYERLSDIIETSQDDPTAPYLTPEETQRYNELSTKGEDKKMTPAQLAAKRGIFKRLSMLRSGEPTTHYYDELNKHLSKMDEAPVLDADAAYNFISRRAWEQGGDKIILAETLFNGNPEFKKWFLDNHIRVNYRDKASNKLTYSYKRLNIWNHKIVNEKYSINTTTTRTDVNGNKVEVVLSQRTPVLKYKMKVVKDEFRTIPLEVVRAGKIFNYETGEMSKYVGTIIDTTGQFLPKNKEQYNAEPAYDETGKVISSPYINDRYYALEKSSPDQFELLNNITRYHLENQRGLDYKSRIYTRLPGFRIGHQKNDTLEQITSGKWWDEKTQTWRKIKSGVAATIKGMTNKEANELSVEAGDYEAGKSNAPQTMDDRIAVQGTSYISPDDISYDLLRTVNRFMISAEKQRVFTEINPIAKAIYNVLHNADTDVKPSPDATAQNSFVTNIIKKVSQSDKTTRAEVFKSLYDREFKGRIFSEAHLDWVNKVTGMLMGGASFSYFALNIPSAVKNYWGALWQMNMEAVAGEHMDIASFAKAKAWTEPAKRDWINFIYGGDKYSLTNQMLMYFDPSQGKLEEDFGTHASRTHKADIASLSWLYSPRKFMEFEASLQLFSGMMYKKKITQTINGVSKEISYIDAFELKGDKMTLKEGIDKSWDIGGKNYLNFKNLIHEKAKDLNGVFAKFEQPQAQAYFAYRLIMFMRRYFTSMFMNRFGKKRSSFVTNEVKQGFYVESVKAIAKILRYQGDYINVISDEEKIALKKSATEAAQIMIVSAIVALIFGYDDDDPERFAKMEQRSGAIGSDNFNLPGFLGNHLLLLFLKTSNENETFIPLPGFGLSDYTKMATVTSIAFGPTITSYAKIITDIAKHAAPGEDQSLYYQRDVGPYPWQKEESAKIWNHIATIWGITGSDIDPVKAGRSYDAIQKTR